MDILLGIDFGTGGCKVTALGIDGTIVGEAAVEYTTWFEHPGWSEQNPADWYDAMCRALRLLRDRGVALGNVRSVAFDGSTHNAVLLDAEMKVVRRTIMWTDQRSGAECEWLRANHGQEIFRTAWQMPTPTWTLPQLMWLGKNEPETLARVRHILFVKDYVRYLVTGVAVTDHIEAQGTLFYDMNNHCWALELAALAGVTPDMLPELVSPTDVVGRITRQAAMDTYLPEGATVVCGSSDSAVEDYGAGAIEPGDAIIKLATAGNVNVMTANATPHERTLTYSHIIDGMWYTVSATNAAALCQRWFRDSFCAEEKSRAQQNGVGAYALMDELAAQSPPGANGVMFHPYLQGERSPYWDSSLRGSFTGIGIASGKGDFVRALLEGVAFSLLDCYGLIRELELPVKRIFLIGGGGRSALWSEIICNVFDLPLQVSLPGDASFGSALLAGVGGGYFPTPAEAVRRNLRIDRELKPSAEKVEVYRELFARYIAVHDALAPIYHRKKI